MNEITIHSYADDPRYVEGDTVHFDQLSLTPMMRIGLMNYPLIDAPFAEFWRGKEDKEGFDIQAVNEKIIPKSTREAYLQNPERYNNWNQLNKEEQTKWDWYKMLKRVPVVSALTEEPDLSALSQHREIPGFTYIADMKFAQFLIATVLAGTHRIPESNDRVRDYIFASRDGDLRHAQHRVEGESIFNKLIEVYPGLRLLFTQRVGQRNPNQYFDRTYLTMREHMEKISEGFLQFVLDSKEYKLINSEQAQKINKVRLRKSNSFEIIYDSKTNGVEFKWGKPGNLL